MIVLLVLFACVDDSGDPWVPRPVDTAADTDTDTDSDTDSDSDTDTDTDSDSDTDADADLALTDGTWVSAGDDLSPLLVYGEIVEVRSRFTTTSYEVTARDDGGTSYVFSGTYTVSGGAAPQSIVLNQTSPSAVVSEGIFQVDGRVLTFETVQTSPSIGCAPPTRASGFGTTRCSQTIPEGANVQIYRQ
jgi:hypothetical protein